MRISDWSSDVCSSDLAPRLDDGEIGGQPRLENIALAAEDFFLFAFGDDRADARARIEADDARAAGAQPLGERALRIEFELEKAGQILPLEFLILPDIGGDHLAHLAALAQQAEAEIVDPRIVRDDGEILDR